MAICSTGHSGADFAMISSIFEGAQAQEQSEIKFDPGSNVTYNVYRDYILEASKYASLSLPVLGNEVAGQAAGYRINRAA